MVVEAATLMPIGESSMDSTTQKAVGSALSRVPGGLFVLCAKHEDRRAGMLTGWVQQVCFEPPMISVAVSKGHPIMPLISEARQFGLCQIGQDHRLLMRKFSQSDQHDDDPFLGFELVREPTLDLPLLRQALSYLECTLVCHMDVEGDHDLFVGQIHSGACNGGEPYIHLREDGFDY
jgi:flavin reductase (DIM6/NTAB) family NADH-FMN oxidoreductase RutF